MPQAGYVYIVRGIGTNFIKVGKSTNLLQRLLALQQGVPFTLQLISAQLVYDADAAEQAIKDRYAQYLTRGEWFALPEELLRQWPVDAAVHSLFTAEASSSSATLLSYAEVWLVEYLHAGPMPTTTIIASATAVGIKESTLRRARRRANIRVTRQDNAWYWQLTEPVGTV